MSCTVGLLSLPWRLSFSAFSSTAGLFPSALYCIFSLSLSLIHSRSLIHPYTSLNNVSLSIIIPSHLTPTIILLPHITTVQLELFHFILFFPYHYHLSTSTSASARNFAGATLIVYLFIFARIYGQTASELSRQLLSAFDVPFAAVGGVCHISLRKVANPPQTLRSAIRKGARPPIGITRTITRKLHG